MIGSSGFGLVAAASLTAAAYFALRYYSLNRQLRFFRVALRDRLKGLPVGGAAVGSNAHLSALWRLTNSLNEQMRRDGSENNSISQLLDVGHRVSISTEDISISARAVGELLFKQSAPEVCAIAIAHRSTAGGPLKLIYSNGLISPRSEPMLLSYLERAVDSGRDSSYWGYRYCADGFDHDFSAIGIGSILSSPIGDLNSISGLIWLGFRSSSPPSSDKVRFVRALCEYNACTFAAADHVHKSFLERDKQRDFLIGMSHDLRAPGNSALYSLRDLLSGDLGELSADHRLRLEIVEDCLEDQLDMLGDILDYTKHQRGLLNANKENVALRSAISKVVECYASNAAQRGIQFTCAELSDGFVSVDARHFKRILSNLFSNAVKYTDRGSIELRVTKHTDSIEVSVLDTGCGIAEEEKNLLFKEFSRLKGAESKQGAGLGLVIAKTLAELNGGKLDYFPRTGGGSEFRLSLPRGYASHDPATAPIASILIVDDDAATGRTLKRYVENISQQVKIAQSASEAIAIFEESLPALIISDFNLGGSSAAEIFSWMNARSISIPAIIVSGSGDRIGVQQHKSAGPVIVLEKPVDRASLERAIQNAAKLTLNAAYEDHGPV